MIDILAVFLFVVVMQVKHFLVDFAYQPEWMWRNKGDLEHPGGYVHAGLHSITTALIIMSFGFHWYLVVLLAAVDFLSHYVIDYTKMNSCKALELTPAKPGFYIALGLDQMAHQLVYAFIVLMLFV